MNLSKPNRYAISSLSEQPSLSEQDLGTLAINSQSLAQTSASSISGVSELLWSPRVMLRGLPCGSIRLFTWVNVPSKKKVWFWCTTKEQACISSSNCNHYCHVIIYQAYDDGQCFLFAINIRFNMMNSTLLFGQWILKPTLPRLSHSKKKRRAGKNRE